MWLRMLWRTGSTKNRGQRIIHYFGGVSLPAALPKKSSYAVTPAEVSSALPTLSKGETVRRLTKTALPIGLGALAVNLAGLVDTTFLQMRMGDLMATQQETLLSCYNAYAGKNKEALQSGVTAVLRLTCLFCIPAGLGLSVFCSPSKMGMDT